MNFTWKNFTSGSAIFLSIAILLSCKTYAQEGNHFDLVEKFSKSTEFSIKYRDAINPTAPTSRSEIASQFNFEIKVNCWTTCGEALPQVLGQIRLASSAVGNCGDYAFAEIYLNGPNFSYQGYISEDGECLEIGQQIYVLQPSFSRLIRQERVSNW
jgi:hypothetical protein